MTSRYQVYGGLEFPPSCSREVAWQVLKAALLTSNYWLSVVELQCFAANSGVQVRVVVDLGHHASADTRLEEQRPGWKHVCAGLANSAAVVLQIGEDRVQEQR